MQQYAVWIISLQSHSTSGEERETNNMQLIRCLLSNLLSQQVSGIIMPIIRRTGVCTAAYGVLHWLWWLWLCGAGTRAVLLMMGIMIPETCWDKRFDNKHRISCILLVSLSSPYVHDARSQEPKIHSTCFACHSTHHQEY